MHYEINDIINIFIDSSYTVLSAADATRFSSAANHGGARHFVRPCRVDTGTARPPPLTRRSEPADPPADVQCP